jgi:hypothetical protein
MTAMRDRVHVGQHWRRRRDGFEVRIRQLHRADQLAIVEPITLRIDDVIGKARTLKLGFRALHDDYVEVHDAA